MNDSLRKVIDAPYDEALARVPPALQTEGFGVLTEIDVKDTLHKKLGVDFRRYKILGACNPGLAHQALQADLDVGTCCRATSWCTRTGRGRPWSWRSTPHRPSPPRGRPGSAPWRRRFEPSSSG